MSSLALHWSNTPPPCATGRPRLAFFRPDLDDLPDFINKHLEEHVRCLAEFFDVVLIGEDCDYDEVCDQVQPALSLFESGVYVRPDRRITNTHRHPNVPKLGLINADAYCLTRSVFLSDMDEWGVESFFTISMVMRDRLPADLRERMYIWPNFADSARFRTQPGGKTTRILFAGSQAAHYPWRQRVNALLSERYPVHELQHSGWESANATKAMVSGEPYVRALGAALIAPTCGTVAKELVRKHLEIPAAGTLLLAERTAAVEAAGFVDMESCVYADESDVLDKMEYLLARPEEIARITANGQALAHSRHDLANRNQIFQWWRLNTRRKLGEVIVQPDAFGEMVLRPGPSCLAAPTPPVGSDWAIIADGDRAYDDGRLDSARTNYQAATAYHYQPEAALGLARTELSSGRAELGLQLVWKLLSLSMLKHGAVEPDPVEWSVAIVALLCAGRARVAIRLARHYSLITHPELERVRQLCCHLSGRKPPEIAARYRLSLHRERELSWKAWLTEVISMLEACGQRELAGRAAYAVGPQEQASAPLASSRGVGRRSRYFCRRHWTKSPPVMQLARLRTLLHYRTPAP